MWEELQELDKKIDKLRERVRRAMEPSAASAREVTSIISQEITCQEDDLQPKQAIFYNGSPDSFVIHRFSVFVFRELTSFGTRNELDRYAFGYINGRSNTFSIFDFSWNYVINSRQSAYSRQNVGSPIFNGYERSQAYDLYEPLILKPADSVEFRMQPLCYPLPGSPGKNNFKNYNVNFVGFGYRRPL